MTTKGLSDKALTQRNNILDAALKAFSFSGYSGTNISTVAVNAGVSHGLIHHYFKSKEELFSTLVSTGLNYMRETRIHAVSYGKTPEEKLCLWVYSIVYSLDQKETEYFSRLVLQILGAPGLHPKISTKKLEIYTQGEIEFLTKLISEYQEDSIKGSRIACLLFNTILGNKLIGTVQPSNFDQLFKMSYRILEIDRDIGENLSSPELPSFSWHLNITKK